MLLPILVVIVRLIAATDTVILDATVVVMAEVIEASILPVAKYLIGKNKADGGIELLKDDLVGDFNLIIFYQLKIYRLNQTFSIIFSKYLLFLNLSMNL
jgi:hypothetical protein